MRDRIDAAGAPGVTSHNAAQREVAAHCSTVPLDRFDRVDRACRLEPALAAEPGTEQQPVAAQGRREQTLDHARHFIDQTALRASAQSRPRRAPHDVAPQTPRSGTAAPRTTRAGEPPRSRAAGSGHTVRTPHGSRAGSSCASLSVLRIVSERPCQAKSPEQSLEKRHIRAAPSPWASLHPQALTAPIPRLLTSASIQDKQSVRPAGPRRAPDDGPRNAGCWPGCGSPVRSRSPSSGKSGGSWPRHGPQGSPRHDARRDSSPGSFTCSNGQPLAPFRATRIDHGAAAARFHAHEEAVRSSATDFGGLIRAFHRDVLGAGGARFLGAGPADGARPA